MKRLHVNLTVADLERSIRFYTSLFAAEPAVRKPDYAKWMLDDPRVNFAISTHGARKGLDHLGIQVEDKAELEEVEGRLETAGLAMLDRGETVCCYARSEKTWTVDPEGLAWETFLTHGESTVYGREADAEIRAASGACCAGTAAADSKARSSACC